MGKGRSHRNRNANRRSLQLSGGLACLPPPRQEPSSSATSRQALSGIPLGQCEEPLVTAGMSRQARRLAERERRKSPQGSVPPISAAGQLVPRSMDHDSAPLPTNRALSVPRAQWIETLRGWLGSITYRWKRAVPTGHGAVDRSALEKLRRDLAQTQATLDGMIAGLPR